MNIIQYLSGVSWVADPPTLSILYKAIVRIRRLLLIKRLCIKLISSNNQQLIKKILPHPMYPQSSLTTGIDLLYHKFPKLSHILLNLQLKHKYLQKYNLWPF